MWVRESPQVAGKQEAFTLKLYLDDAAEQAGSPAMPSPRSRKNSKGQTDPLPKIHQVKHHNALPYSDIADFMGKLRSRGGTAPTKSATTGLTKAYVPAAAGDVRVRSQV